MSDEELWNTLMRFHREVFVPDFTRILDEALIDGLHLRFDVLDSEVQSLTARVTRLADRS